MAEAILFGLAASSALVLGGVLGSYWQAPTQVTGILLAFASGALISALAFELFSDAVEEGGITRAGLALLAGAATFVVANWWLDSRVSSPEQQQHEKVKDAADAAGRGPTGAVGLALLAAVTLDGVPENAALGVSLIHDTSYTLLVAIFFSNLPESLVGSMAMREEGRSARFAIGLWMAAAVLLALAVVIGRVAMEGVGGETLAWLLAFAGGAVLASLADTLMPEAFERGRPVNAFATCAGFFLSFMLAG